MAALQKHSEFQPSNLILLACLAMLGGGVSLDAAELRDYLIQKVCVDAGGTVLIADPWQPPAGATLRNLAIGEKLPYFKHDQPMPGLPSGYQRHDSYPALDAAGNEIIVNPFYYGDHPGNGVDVYRILDGWTSVGETQDGGGFSTTFFGWTMVWSGPLMAVFSFPSRYWTRPLRPSPSRLPLPDATGSKMANAGPAKHQLRSTPVPRRHSVLSTIALLVA